VQVNAMKHFAAPQKKEKSRIPAEAIAVGGGLLLAQANASSVRA